MGVTPAASSAHVRPLGSSRRASGFPAASATMRSTTRGSSGTSTVGDSSARASSSQRPSTSSSGRPASSGNGSRVAKSSATRSARRRRATKPSVWADSLSSHWASSTTQISGCRSAVADRRLSTARPTRNRSGAGPLRSPKAIPRAACCGAGSSAASSRTGKQSWWSAAKGSSTSASTPPVRTTRKPRAESTANSRRADFPTPGSPRKTRLAPCPPWAADSSCLERAALDAATNQQHRSSPPSCWGPGRRIVAGGAWSGNGHLQPGGPSSRAAAPPGYLRVRRRQRPGSASGGRHPTGRQRRAEVRARRRAARAQRVRAPHRDDHLLVVV